MSKNIVVIVAGGKGSRMGKKISKQFLKINDKPILYYTIKTFDMCEDIDEIILVIGKEDIDYFNETIKSVYKFNKLKKIVQGGCERQHSVYNGLKACGEECDVVLIHDGARPFVTEDIIKNGIKFAQKYKASACGVMPKDTIKVKGDRGMSIKTLNRKDLIAVQTPQCFQYELIMKAHEYIKNNDIEVTDDTMVVELIGEGVYLYEGEYTNIKITTPEDLILANYLVNNKFNKVT